MSGDDLHLALRIFKKHLDGNVDVHIAVDAHLPNDAQLVLDEHLRGDDKVFDRRVAGVAQSARLAQRKGEQRDPKVFQPCGGGLRRQIARGVGPLRPVAQQNDAQEPFAGLAPQHVVNRRPQGGLLAVGLVGQLDFAAIGGNFVKLGVEAVCSEFEIALQSVERGRGVGQSGTHRVPAGFVAYRVGHRHAPRLIGQHHERGRLFFRLRIDQRRPKHGQNDQRDRAQTQRGQHRPASSSQLGAARPEPQKR